MTLADSHCHLDDEQFDQDREIVIERALEAGISQILAVGTGQGPPDLEAGIRLAEKYPFIFATVGIHPHDASKANQDTFRRLNELLANPKVVALGEIGLDYHYDFSPREKQQEIFIEQLRLAGDAGIPVIIHTREAWHDTLELLKKHWIPAGLGGIMHCFSGGPAEALLALELGFHVSFAGIVTFPKALNVQEAVKKVPLDKLLVETDAPYLAPTPRRGKRNEPAFIVETVKKVAELKGESFETIAAVTLANFQRLCLPQDNDKQ